MTFRAARLGSSALACVIAATMGPAARAQQTPVRDNRPPAAAASPLGSIAGRVVAADDDHQAVGHAQLLIIGQDNAYLRVVEADTQGQFTFPNLPSGRYLVGAAKPPFVSGSYGATRPGRPGTPVRVGDGQRLTGLVVKMTRGGVVSGSVTDERGQPVPNAPVRLLPVSMRNGERVIGGSSASMLILGSSQGPTTTDDRGIYRVFGLTPGEYVALVTPPNTGGDIRVLSNAEIQAGLQAVRDAGRPAGPGTIGPPGPFVNGVPGPPVPGRGSVAPPASQGQAMGFVPIYFPGTADSAEAATIKIGPGEIREGIDIRTQLVPMSRLEGVVTLPSGEPLNTVQVSLRQGGGVTPMSGLSALLGFTGMQSSARPNAAGEFALNAVPPGRYTLMARSQPSGGGGGAGGQSSSSGASLWASMDVFVSGQNISGLSLVLQRGLTASGKVVVKSYGTPVPENLNLQVAVRPPQTDDFFLGLGGSGSATQADRSFVVDGLVPGRYSIAATVNPSGPSRIADLLNWTVESVTVGGRDVTDQLVDLRQSDSLADVVVTLSDRKQSVVGTLQDAAGRAAPDFTVVLFSTDPRHWFQGSRRIQTARPGTDGRFELTGFGGVPAGTYYLAALSDLGTEEQYDALLLGEIAKAGVKFTVAPGEIKRQDLRIK